MFSAHGICSLSTGITHALETEEAQRLTLQIAAQSTSTVCAPESNGDCFVAIVVNDEGFDGNLSTRCDEQMNVKRIRIVDRVKNPAPCNGYLMDPSVRI